MDRDDVGEPERQIGQIDRKDFLNFAAESLPFFAIRFSANLLDERVDARVAVVSAICAVRRKALRRKNKFKHVGIEIGGIGFDKKNQGRRVVVVLTRRSRSREKETR